MQCTDAHQLRLQSLDVQSQVDKTVSDALRERVKFLVEDPARELVVNPNAPIKVTNLPILKFVAAHGTSRS
jgi:hypothetical protein